MIYAPTLTEAEYLSRSVEQTLAGASKDARDAVLALLIRELDDAEIAELQRRGRELDTKRRPS